MTLMEVLSQYWNYIMLTEIHEIKGIQSLLLNYITLMDFH